MLQRLSLLAALALGCVAAGSHAPAAEAAAIGDAKRLAPSERAPRGPLFAPAETCPGEASARAGSATHEEAMLCLISFAREKAGLPALAGLSALAGSAARKSDDLLACDDFSHFACGRPFSHWIRATGYTEASCWRIGENIAWGRGERGTARAIFEALMRSPTHRANLLGAYEHIGIDSRVGSLGPFGRVRVWTQHFGTRCGAPA